MELTQVNEEELTPQVDNPLMTNVQPVRLKCEREFKPTKKYTEYKQQLTAKLTAREDFVKYREENKTKFLNNPSLLARKSSTDSDTLDLQKH
jgi:hypothetical protein